MIPHSQVLANVPLIPLHFPSSVLICSAMTTDLLWKLLDCNISLVKEQNFRLHASLGGMRPHESFPRTWRFRHGKGDGKWTPDWASTIAHLYL